MSVSIDSDLYWDLVKVSLVYFKNNKSRVIDLALRDYLSTVESNRKMAEKLMKELKESLRPSPEEETREKHEREERERKWQEEVERKKRLKRQKEEFEKKLKSMTKKVDPEVEKLKNDYSYQLWSKHLRQVRADPDHYPEECSICNLYPE